MGALVGPASGWATFAAGLLALIAYHVRHLARLARWLANPVPGRVPEGSGTWDDVLSALHKYERAAARRENLLEEGLTRFRRAAQALPDGVIMLDDETRIEWCNDAAAAQLGLDPRADVGQAIANLLRAPAFIDYLAMRDRSAAVRLPIGNAIFALQLVPYGESQQLLLSRDVTQAERLETMRRDFVANVSHELRTPLTVLVGFLETVRELKLDPQRTRDYLGMMQDQSARMQRIIEDLLTLSVLESAPPPATDRVPTRALLERLRAEAEALSAGRHRITLQASPAVDLLGSESELSSAFGNLVSNAIRYTPQDGEVRILWRDAADGASFSVEDTGIGIAQEHLPRLTERFYRIDRSRSRETGGTGLGLAIVKHAIARHQAHLDVESKPGNGSRFTIRFPAKRTVPSQPDLAHTGNSIA
ncbi:MAG: two-component system, OmpR family, phosphate regulon sensor histidine kinase PhoR [Betaproteobacteria bacterium]|nr:two-component system, OmpR family, phosphate regulon sensor histidine kinase PhoR [Betaproteobacteria bacterium]